MYRACIAFVAAWLAFGASAAEADYLARWDRVGGGWTTGWIRHNGSANICGHYAPGCRCGSQNFCGPYPHGAVTTWWPNGCGRPAWQVRCTIQPTGAPGGSQGVRIDHPRIRGISVDWCTHWGTNCGKGGADLYCRSIGYAGAADWSTFRPGRTWVIGSNQQCVGDFCVGFQHVTCVRQVGGPAPSHGGIAVLSAYYGLNCAQTDPGRNKNVTQHVAQSCNGRGQCTYQVNHHVIGDPAYGCEKDFRIRYRCAGAGDKQAYVRPEASGQAAHLSCP